MASILSAGAAFAGNTIPKQGIAEPHSEIERELARDIAEPKTVLNLDYLSQSSNVDVWKGKDFLDQTPTDLGFEACKQAIDRAGLTADQIGLLIGSCSTPLETTPSEAQRVGCRLGVKIPAYDLYSGGADFSLYLRNLLRWKKERTPQYVLFFSTHCPTTRTRYDTGGERFLFSDGAGAIVCSLADSGPFIIQHSEISIQVARSQDFRIELYGHLHFDPKVEAEVLNPMADSLLKKISSQYPIDTLVENQLSPAASKKLNFGRQDSLLGDVAQYGSQLGAGPFVALAQHWDQLLKRDNVAVLSTGIGLGAGITVLSRSGEGE